MACSREKILSNSYFNIFSNFDPTASLGIMEYEYCLQKVEEDLYVGYVSEEIIEGYELGLIKNQFVPKCYGLMQQTPDMYRDVDTSFNLQPLINAGITKVNGAPLNLTGRGVVLAFIDTGIRYDLNVFRNPDGSTRILSIWDQTIQTGTPPAEFDYGSEYSREMIDEALKNGMPFDIVPSRDENGHGTKIASVAAGSLLTGENAFRGAAYDAQIVVVKLKQAKENIMSHYSIPEEAICFCETDIVLALKYVQKFCQPLIRPVVICLGIGSNQGDHRGTSVLSQYLNVIGKRPSMSTIVCGGNEGNQASHYEGIIDLQRTDSYDEIELKVGENEAGFIIEIWGSIPTIYTVAIQSPDGEFVQRILYKSGRRSEYSFIYSKTVITVEYILVEQRSGEQLVFLNFVTPLAGIWKIRVYGSGNNKIARFDAWLPIRNFLRGDTFFLRSNPYTTLTIPAYAANTLTTSTFDSFQDSFYVNSGRGFSRQGEIVPDVAAPGVNISTILGMETGASMAAAICAGAAADFMQWAVIDRGDRSINNVGLQNYFIRGARRSGNMDYPNREWGYGQLNVAGIFDVLATR